MNLKTLTKEILSDLSNIIIQLNRKDFIQPLELLSGSNVGQHIRHIIDFYDCILKVEKTMIKIALNQHFDYVKYPSQFGIAFSTLSYLKTERSET